MLHGGGWSYFECELEKSKGKELKLKKGCNGAFIDYEKVCNETSFIVERFEMLVDELKTKMTKDILIFQKRRTIRSERKKTRSG